MALFPLPVNLHGVWAIFTGPRLPSPERLLYWVQTTMNLPNRAPSPSKPPESLAQKMADKVLRGTVSRLTFRNPENGYGVIQVKLDSEVLPLTVTGPVARFQEGANIILRGNYEEHAKFGRQFKAYSAEEVQPRGPEEIQHYLSTGVIKGIGPKTAQKIVATFGEDTLKILYRDPERLQEVGGIGKQKAEQIKESFSERRERFEIEQFLLSHNLSMGLSERIYRKYGNKAVETVNRNPYLLAQDFKGVGFLTADSVALSLGFAIDSPFRIKAGMFYALMKSREDGHCLLPNDQLVRRTVSLLRLNERSLEELDFRTPLFELEEDGYIIRDGDYIYLRSLFEAEFYVSEFIRSRTAPFPAPRLNEADIESALSATEEELHIQFSPEQRLAVSLASKYPLLLVTGGPGCGKTTVIRALARVFENSHLRIVLGAPTGKAAQRMGEMSGLPAKTIHRLLKFDPVVGEFFYNALNPLKDDDEEIIDAVIIDEASMLDLPLAKDLFASIPKEATLILVGDMDQLPSVGPGRVFADLLSIPTLQTLTLSQLFRRSEESRITSIAHAINSGLNPGIPVPDGQVRSDAYFIDRRNPEEAARTIASLFSEQVPKKFSIDQSDITVLSPSNRGPLGISSLNSLLQDTVNGERTKRERLLVGEREFRVGDRVCQRVNNYRLGIYGVFNGDIGVIRSILPDDQELDVELWDGRIVRYKGKDLFQLSLSYAMTIHRSQGSEMPCVIIALDTSHHLLLERQLFYTGVTRAKKLLIVVGNRQAVERAVKTTSTKKRLTKLRERIIGEG